MGAASRLSEEKSSPIDDEQSTITCNWHPCIKPQIMSNRRLCGRRRAFAQTQNDYYFTHNQQAAPLYPSLSRIVLFFSSEGFNWIWESSIWFASIWSLSFWCCYIILELIRFWLLLYSTACCCSLSCAARCCFDWRPSIVIAFGIIISNVVVVPTRMKARDTLQFNPTVQSDISELSVNNLAE